MTHQFKPGDRVECVRAAHSFSKNYTLDVGGVYTVWSLDRDGDLTFDEIPGNWAHEDFVVHFEPVSATNGQAPEADSARCQQVNQERLINASPVFPREPSQEAWDLAGKLARTDPVPIAAALQKLMDERDAATKWRCELGAQAAYWERRAEAAENEARRLASVVDERVYGS